MARLTRFERATPTFGGLYSNPAELQAHETILTLNVVILSTYFIVVGLAR